jgi:hypothetical protein
MFDLGGGERVQGAAAARPATARNRLLFPRALLRGNQKVADSDLKLLKKLAPRAGSTVSGLQTDCTHDGRRSKRH